MLWLLSAYRRLSWMQAARLSAPLLYSKAMTPPIMRPMLPILIISCLYNDNSTEGKEDDIDKAGITWKKGPTTLTVL
jgi:hypothetical protein